MVTLPADNVAVILPKSMSFTGSDFKPVNSDPGVLTFLAKNATPGKALVFTVSGTGSLPREQQGGQGAQGDNGQPAAAPTGQPGGGIGVPINTPNPLSKYTWWILGGLAILLIAAAGIPAAQTAGPVAFVPVQGVAPGQPAASLRINTGKPERRSAQRPERRDVRDRERAHCRNAFQP